MDHPMERRRFSRIQVSLPVEYQTMLADTETPFRGQGVLRDISLGGTYFHVEPDTYFQKGQVLSLTISAPLPYLDLSGVSHLQATGEVIRFEPSTPTRPQPGVALQFLEGPTFCTSPPSPMF
jgi:c-di-GMP-binding flagellar brake protein YcgR